MKWLPDPSDPNCFPALAIRLGVEARCPAGGASDSAVSVGSGRGPFPTPAGSRVDLAVQRLKVVGQAACEVELGGDHAAADVDADGGRDHGVPWWG